MIYILVEDYGYDGNSNKWAGTNVVQLFDIVHQPKMMSLVEDNYYDLCVQVFGLDGQMTNNVYLVPSDTVSLEKFKEALKR